MGSTLLDAFARIVSIDVSRNWQTLPAALMGGIVSLGTEFGGLTNEFERVGRRLFTSAKVSPKPTPLRAAYSRELLRIIFAEVHAELYFERLALSGSRSGAASQLRQLRDETRRHLVQALQLLRDAGPESEDDVEMIESCVEREIITHVSMSSYGATLEDGLILAAVRIESFLLIQYRNARNTARFLGLRRDRDRLSALYAAKAARIDALERLSAGSGSPEQANELATASFSYL